MAACTTWFGAYQVDTNILFDYTAMLLRQRLPDLRHPKPMA
jgi:hypothetical protein